MIATGDSKGLALLTERFSGLGAADANKLAKRRRDNGYLLDPASRRGIVTLQGEPSLLGAGGRPARR